jgi:hypothetical protein
METRIRSIATYIAVSIFFMIAGEALCQEKTAASGAAPETQATTTVSEQDIKRAEIINQAEALKKYDWSSGNYYACLKLGDCDDLVACPNNRACFNNCNIGRDPDTWTKAFAASLAGMFGIDVESSYRTMCLGDCIRNKELDCNNPNQATDITNAKEAPPIGDPAGMCLQFCGGDKGSQGRFFWCWNTCKNLLFVGPCLDQNPTNFQDVCSNFGGFVENPGNDFDDPPYVSLRLKSFIWDAFCARNPKLPQCNAMCDDQPVGFPWSRTCRDLKAAMKIEMNKVNEEAVQNAQAASASIEGTQAGVSEAEKTRIANRKLLEERLRNQENNQ